MIPGSSVEPSVENLLKCYFAGNPQGLEQLLSTPSYRDRVRRIAHKRTRGTTLSPSDVEQEAYIKVLQALRAQKFRSGGIEEFYRWATSVAYHAIIDLVREEQRKQKFGIWKSLEQKIAGTELELGETIADELDLLDALERADLICQAIQAIRSIDQRYADRNYLNIWERMVRGYKQSQIAQELGMTQGTVSKRLKELGLYVLEELGLLEISAIQQKKPVVNRVRSRSLQQW